MKLMSPGKQTWNNFFPFVPAAAPSSTFRYFRVYIDWPSPEALATPQSCSWAAVTLSQVPSECRGRVYPQSCCLLVYIFHPWLSPERLTAPAGHNASVDLGPELLTYSVYFYWDEVRDVQQKYCIINKHNGAATPGRKGQGRNTLFKPIPLFFLFLTDMGFVFTQFHSRHIWVVFFTSKECCFSEAVPDSVCVHVWHSTFLRRDEA